MSKRHAFIRTSVGLWLVLAGTASAQPFTADYLVAFEATWSAETHPVAFPGNPHFSGLVGAVHDASVSFWTPGGAASPGIESMAETGSKEPLLSEIDAALQSGGVVQRISESGVARSPGTLRFALTVTAEHPFVTLVTMLAPSPDWFVGVSGHPLFTEAGWVEADTVELFVYDAGTDSGTFYTAPDQDTNPQVPITRLDASPFLVSGMVRSVGMFTFVRQQATAVSELPDAPSATHVLRPAHPNPFREQTTLTLTVSAPQHVRAVLFDLRGRRVATLWDGALAPAVPHRLAVEADGLPAGVYFVHVAGESFRETRPVIVSSF